MFIDLTGENFGKWKVLRRISNDVNGGARYECKCQCGKIKEIRANSLRYGKATSCGCDYRDFYPYCNLPEYVTKENLKNYYKALTYIGSKFNRLQLLEIIGVKRRLFMGKFQCECGNISVINISGVVKNRYKSCGCLRKDSVSSLAKHNMSGTEFYRRWASVKARCKDEKDLVYGGKGISYDPRWEYFENFYEDMHEGFSSDLEIDRIDVTKGYYKENCRWTNHSENNFNKNKQSNNISGKTGVCFHKQTNKYRAYITKDGKQKNLGLYNNIEDAIQVRIAAEIEIYGYTRP